MASDAISPRREQRDKLALVREGKEQLARVAAAEAVERLYTRAKDATALYDAVEKKLAAQRRFVLWWDRNGLQKGGGYRRSPSQTADGDNSPSETADGDSAPTLRNVGLDRETLRSWRKRLKDEQAFAATLAQAQARALRICEFKKGNAELRGASGTNENEWFTPGEYIEAARDVLGAIDLDPASHPVAQETVRATRFFTYQDNGLSYPWPGRIWLNPPYMQPHISDFVGHLVDEVIANRTTAAILLTHNYTDTAWFHLAAGACRAICFTRGRIAFVSPTGEEAAPTQGQAFFYFGAERERFITRFSELGFVVMPADQG